MTAVRGFSQLRVRAEDEPDELDAQVGDQPRIDREPGRVTEQRQASQVRDGVRLVKR
jgi:hypothetical protein